MTTGRINQIAIPTGPSTCVEKPVATPAVPEFWRNNPCNKEAPKTPQDAGGASFIAEYACGLPKKAKRIRATATRRAAPANDHTEPPSSRGQPSYLTGKTNRKDQPDADASASGHGSSTEPHRSTLDKPSRTPGLPERRLRCMLGPPKYDARSASSRRPVACDLCTVRTEGFFHPSLFAWRTNARVFYPLARTLQEEDRRHLARGTARLPARSSIAPW